MRVGELREREPFDQVLRETLALAWGEESKADVVVSTQRGAQPWYLSWPFGMYHVRGPSASVRQFVRDSLRFTPKRWRIPAQFVLATVMSSGVGVRAGARFAFTVDPAVPGARHRLVMPGNQRLRIFDFARGKVRVVLKSNFTPDGIRRELGFRQRTDAVFLIPLLAHDEEERWFEEEIMDGFVPLPRCAPWMDQEAIAERALVMWETWSKAEKREKTSIREYGERVLGRILEQIKRLDERGLQVRGVVDREFVERLVRSLGVESLELGTSHGDFQPGNVLVSAGRASRLKIVDWENVGQRACWYDRLVLGFASRYGGNLAGRMMSFLRGDVVSPLLDGTSISMVERRDLISLFCLEELDWHLTRATEGTQLALPPALLEFCLTLSRVGGALCA